MYTTTLQELASLIRQKGHTLIIFCTYAKYFICDIMYYDDIILYFMFLDYRTLA